MTAELHYLPVISYLPSLSQYVSLKFSNKELLLWIPAPGWGMHLLYSLFACIFIPICKDSCLVITQEEQDNKSGRLL